MTLIDFYVLSQDNKEAQRQFACRLIEKAVRQGNRVMVSTCDEEETLALDKQLWNFRPDAFVPHKVLGDASSPDTQVVLSHNSYDDSHHDVLLNLKPNIPGQFSRFKRLAEVVTQDKLILDNSRKSYAYYKSRGYPINTNKIK